MTNLHVACSSIHVLTVIADVHLNDVECKREGGGEVEVHMNSVLSATASYVDDALEIPYSGKIWRALNLAKWLCFDTGEI